MSVPIQVSEEAFLRAKEIADLGRISVAEVFEAALVEQVEIRERLKQRAAKGSGQISNDP